MTVLHTTFTLERDYPCTPERVFAAWADPATKARWFTALTGEHRLDFRVGGTESVLAPAIEDRPALRFEAVYHDIVPNERIVYTGVLYQEAVPATVSLTTVQLAPTEAGTRLLLTEQGTFLDDLEQPRWREQGTGDQLKALAAELS
ncbi:MAG TPA: SRPBCC family protein [Actinophytocola sp.]|uniref:SRPBCC family protein n=1 Tax=Actinophytocola sp. TaxID=1872138 RepID=UPI002DB80691|nr:SRPBCC family protein [Actinophytocola sp.]HEU5470666.1 SRPBCC family protein [Actinophytocola sp.]